MDSNQQHWLRSIESERLALRAENAHLRRQLATTYWVIVSLAGGAVAAMCVGALWVWG